MKQCDLSESFSLKNTDKKTTIAVEFEMDVLLVCLNFCKRFVVKVRQLPCNLHLIAQRSMRRSLEGREMAWLGSITWKSEYFQFYFKYFEHSKKLFPSAQSTSSSSDRPRYQNTREFKNL